MSQTFVLIQILKVKPIQEWMIFKTSLGKYERFHWKLFTSTVLLWKGVLLLLYHLWIQKPKRTVSSFMSTYLSQCLKSQRFFCLDKETISAKDMNPKYPDIKLGIFLLNKLQKNADSGFFERKWFNHFFFPPWGK